MNPTETQRVDALAIALFDAVVAPSTTALCSSGRPAYFAMAGDAGLTSYFEAPTLAVMQGPDFDFPGGGTPDGLIDALARFWSAQGEAGLAAMAPRFKDIALALREETAEAASETDILCYTMF